MEVTLGCHIPNFVSIDWLREQIRENPIFHWKIFGFRFRFSFKSTYWLLEPNQLLTILPAMIWWLDVSQLVVTVPWRVSLVFKGEPCGSTKRFPRIQSVKTKDLCGSLKFVWSRLWITTFKTYEPPTELPAMCFFSLFRRLKHMITCLRSQPSPILQRNVGRSWVEASFAEIFNVRWLIPVAIRDPLPLGEGALKPVLLRSDRRTPVCSQSTRLMNWLMADRWT